jgi:hypothetical protein
MPLLIRAHLTYSSLRLAEWVLQREATKPTSNFVFGSFYDKKDAHYIISKVRMQQQARDLYVNAKLKVEGFQPPVPPAELVALRKDKEAMSGGGAFKVITAMVQDGCPYVVLPEPASLHFKCSPVLKDRLAQMRKELPAPPAAKRPRTGAGASGGLLHDVPVTIKMDKIFDTFTLAKSASHTVGSPPVHITILRAVRKTDGLIFQFVQNASNIRLTLPAKAHFCSSTRGAFIDKMIEAQKAEQFINTLSFQKTWISCCWF